MNKLNIIKTVIWMGVVTLSTAGPVLAGLTDEAAKEANKNLKEHPPVYFRINGNPGTPPVDGTWYTASTGEKMVEVKLKLENPYVWEGLTRWTTITNPLTNSPTLGDYKFIGHMNKESKIILNVDNKNTSYYLALANGPQHPLHMKVNNVFYEITLNVKKENKANVLYNSSEETTVYLVSVDVKPVAGENKEKMEANERKIEEEKRKAEEDRKKVEEDNKNMEANKNLKEHPPVYFRIIDTPKTIPVAGTEYSASTGENTLAVKLKLDSPHVWEGWTRWTTVTNPLTNSPTLSDSTGAYKFVGHSGASSKFTIEAGGETKSYSIDDANKPLPSFIVKANNVDYEITVSIKEEDRPGVLYNSSEATAVYLVSVDVKSLESPKEVKKPDEVKKADNTTGTVKSKEEQARDLIKKFGGKLR